MAIMWIKDQGVIVQPGQTLLEAAEHAGLALSYHCRQGFCGTCSTRLKKGQISYSRPPIAYCAEGNVLLCCARLTSKMTEVELVLDNETNQSGLD